MTRIVLDSDGNGKLHSDISSAFLIFIQFEKAMSVIQELSTKVHQQHLRHLQDLKKLEDQTRSFAANADPTVIANGTGATLNDFEKLVQGGAGTASGSITPNSNRQSATDNPFKIASDNPFSSPGSSQESPLDMFGEMVRKNGWPVN